mmetsp:Transcript_34087/g.96622  ORF Transcript_34087/g.96622 Transcript_34087/m.96622 type:complete len:560 (+) Transcript_34087:116-1795(+)|eukprot:CAMPEP_0117667004 /NCGR_PEP_ID=MMETSP0804-20121206/10710_1 /TAXON_ID=1074897 /ORGANISM="Tetraselmis astigmatica, Strain CCMP880" /LENGTH=559 /DNA_ID=CAMNT_0005474651 /DNA_START=134 /DNA_END=1813 /DNA_ORIENTATION=+
MESVLREHGCTAHRAQLGASVRRRGGSTSGSPPLAPLQPIRPAARRRGPVALQTSKLPSSQRAASSIQDILKTVFSKSPKVAKGTSMYVSLPPSAFTHTGQLAYPQALVHGLAALKCGGVDGVVVPVVWGLVEGEGPQQYDFTVYKELAEMLRKCGLKMQVSIEFSVVKGLSELPRWLLKIGETDPNIFFQDQYGNILLDCLSMGVDTVPAIGGRTGQQVYSDLMCAFRDAFVDDLGGLIEEVAVGMGPHGELRYPSYPAGKWHFPGVGEFQCYDSHMLTGLQEAARQAGHPASFGERGPADAGHYCSNPQDTAFFKDSGTWKTDSGEFFLQWYSGELLRHGDIMLDTARQVFGGEVVLGMKIPVVHWWHHTQSRAAELTAGIYHTAEHSGYEDLIDLAAKYSAFVQVSCAEMSDRHQSSQAKCSPERILALIREAASRKSVFVGLSNCDMRFDDSAMTKLSSSALDPAFADTTMSVSFVHMSDELFKGYQWGKFTALASKFSRDDIETSTPVPAQPAEDGEEKEKDAPLQPTRPMVGAYTPFFSYSVMSLINSSSNKE